MGYTTGLEKINRMSWACSANAERIRVRKQTDESFIMTAQVKFDLAHDELVALIASKVRVVPIAQKMDAAKSLEQYLYKTHIEPYNASSDLLAPERAKAYAAAELLDCFLDDGQENNRAVAHLERLEAQARGEISIAA
jgi:hypothetical protein